MAWVPSSMSEFGNWTTVPSLYSWNVAECVLKLQLTKPILTFKLTEHHSFNIHHLFIAKIYKKIKHEKINEGINMIIIMWTPFALNLPIFTKLHVAPTYPHRLIVVGV